MFITVFTTARHSPLCCSSWIRSTNSSAIYLTLPVISSCHLVLSNHLFFADFPTKICCVVVVSLVHGGHNTRFQLFYLPLCLMMFTWNSAWFSQVPVCFRHACNNVYWVYHITDWPVCVGARHTERRISKNMLPVPWSTYGQMSRCSFCRHNSWEECFL
jgi:hypothetical protein